MSVVLSRTDLFILFAGDCFFKKMKIKVLTYQTERVPSTREKNLCIKLCFCVCVGVGGGLSVSCFVWVVLVGLCSTCV